MPARALAVLGAVRGAAEEYRSVAPSPWSVPMFSTGFSVPGSCRPGN